MKSIPKHIRLSGDQVQLTAPDANTRRFTMLAYTGAPVQFAGYTMVFDLKGGKVKDKTVILQQHDHKLIVALSDKVMLDDSGLRYEGTLFSTAAAAEVQKLADQGFPWQASMGVEPMDVELREQDGVVNGHNLKAPYLYCGEWAAKESSFVPLGADDATRSLVFADDASGAITVRRCSMSEKETAPQPSNVLELERKRVAEIEGAFPKNPAHALKHIKLGSSLVEAKADYAAVLELELERSKARPDNQPIPGGAAANQGGKTATQRWNEAVQLAEQGLTHLNGKTRTFEAMKLADRKNPGLREQYLDEYNATEAPRLKTARTSVGKGQ